MMLRFFFALPSANENVELLLWWLRRWRLGLICGGLLVIAGVLGPGGIVFRPGIAAERYSHDLRVIHELHQLLGAELRLHHYGVLLLKCDHKEFDIFLLAADEDVSPLFFARRAVLHQRGPYWVDLSTNERMKVA